MPRRALDKYETPPHYIAALALGIGPVKGMVYEPCVGTGCIVKSPWLKKATCFTNDIDTAVEADTHFDATGEDAWGALGYDWIITNPPFSDWLAIAKHAVQWGKQVALLGRLSILEPTVERGPFWEAHPPTGLIVLPRYSFRNNDLGQRQTDSVTCAWIIWQEGKPPCLSVGERANA